MLLPVAPAIPASLKVQFKTRLESFKNFGLVVATRKFNRTAMKQAALEIAGGVPPKKPSPSWQELIASELLPPAFQRQVFGITGVQPRESNCRQRDQHLTRTYTSFASRTTKEL
jgi:hypothetical protein